MKKNTSEIWETNVGNWPPLKPKWAERWLEEEFDYGNMIGMAADVGGKRNAVRTLKRRVVEPEVRDETRWVTVPIYEYCEDCEEDHVVGHKEEHPIIKHAVWEDIPKEELREMAEVNLREWFENEVVKARRFLDAANRTGLAQNAQDHSKSDR